MVTILAVFVYNRLSHRKYAFQLFCAKPNLQENVYPIKLAFNGVELAVKKTSKTSTTQHVIDLNVKC